MNLVQTDFFSECGSFVRRPLPALTIHYVGRLQRRPMDFAKLERSFGKKACRVLRLFHSTWLDC